MTQLLNSLVVRNFRSIKGEIVVNLDAPMVLIHATNAIGKTSIMSAIELALTGDLPGFERLDRNYKKYLVNTGATEATIELTGPAKDKGTVTIRGANLKNRPLLESSLHQYFNERCYLGQAMLSRLLEWYSPGDGREESPLAVFVKDLLGVDRLDALIDGLRPAGDVRRLRSDIPDYGNIENEFEALQRKSKDLVAGIESLSQREHERTAQIYGLIRQLGNHLERPEALLESPPERWLSSLENDRNLSWWTSQRVRLATIRDSWSSAVASSNLETKPALEARSVSAQRALQEWEAKFGSQLSEITSQLEADLTNVPNPAVTDPVFAVDGAIAVLNAEIERCRRTLDSEVQAKAKIIEHNKDVATKESRLTKLTQRLSDLNEATGAFAGALSLLVPYIISELCPVCDRDYSEVSSDSLLAKVTERIDDLTGRGELYQALIAQRDEAERALTIAKRERDRIVSARIPADAFARMEARILELGDLLVRITDLRPAAVNGAEVRRVAFDADRALVLATKRNRQDMAIRNQLADISVTIGEAAPARSETIDKIVRRLMSAIEKQEASLTERAGVQKTIAAEWQACNDLKKELANRKADLARTGGESDRVGERLSLFNDTRDQAKTLRAAAQRAKTTVVRRVFTEALNATWRDLFVRLAPAEPFIPRFVIPDARARGFKIELETLDRKGELAGSPRAMLSTGNLNTAALALFLALNLSIEATVPLLMLDDPVQSMDEVHIAQLAALLRVMSKNERSRRQIIIAVHERSLFEYLRFELAPSYEGDSLRTIELDRTVSGTTIPTNRYISYERETAVA